MRFTVDFCVDGYTTIIFIDEKHSEHLSAVNSINKHVFNHMFIKTVCNLSIIKLYSKLTCFTYLRN